MSLTSYSSSPSIFPFPNNLNYGANVTSDSVNYFANDLSDSYAQWFEPSNEDQVLQIEQLLASDNTLNDAPFSDSASFSANNAAIPLAVPEVIDLDLHSDHATFPLLNVNGTLSPIESSSLSWRQIDNNPAVRLPKHKILHEEIREKLSALWVEGDQLNQQLNVARSTHTEWARLLQEKGQARESNFIKIENLDNTIKQQQEHCCSIYEQKRANPRTNTAKNSELARDLSASLAVLDEQKKERNSQQAQAKELDDEFDTIHKQYMDYFNALTNLQKRQKEIWNRAENLLQQEKQNIDDMLAQERQIPQSPHAASLERVVDYCNDFNDDFYRSHMVLKLPVYQMLLISNRDMLSEYGKQIIHAVLGNSTEEVSVDALDWIKGLLEGEVERALAQLEQEKIPSPHRQNQEKINNINRYMRASKDGYFDVSMEMKRMRAPLSQRFMKSVA